MAETLPTFYEALIIHLHPLPRIVPWCILNHTSYNHLADSTHQSVKLYFYKIRTITDQDLGEYIGDIHMSCY